MRPHRAAGVVTAIVLAAFVATWLSPLLQLPPGAVDGSHLLFVITVR